MKTRIDSKPGTDGDSLHAQAEHSRIGDSMQGDNDQHDKKVQHKSRQSDDQAPPSAAEDPPSNNGLPEG